MNNLLVNTLVAYWDSPIWLRRVLAPFGGVIFKHSNNSRCRDYLSQIDSICKEKNIELTDSLKNDIILSFLMTGSSPSEYFLFNMQDKTLKERDEFITDAYRTQLQKKIIGLDLFKKDLINKFNFYSQNAEFFKRRCIKITNKTTFDEFRSFILEQGKVFIKVNAGSFGFNAHTVTYTDDDSLKEDFRNLHLETGAEWIAEGLVIQDARMAVWNTSSVNTIRIPSYLIEGGKRCEVFRPFIRTGRAGAVVDNAGAGGIFAVIDEITGKIITDGADEAFNRYEEHPDAKIKYKGWLVPMWDELLELAEKAHKCMPNHKYIAYDFALTSNGWVMIEGNWGQYICQQTATQIGAKKKFKELMYK